MTLELGWFSTGNGEGSRGLLQAVLDGIERGHLPVRIQFVFCNREPGEHDGSDRFHRLVQHHGIPLVTLSSRRFARERGVRLAEVREEYDRAVREQLAPYSAGVAVLAGYMLITSAELCRAYTLLNLHPALPDGPAGTWQQVTWQLIEQRAGRSGGMVHLATEEVDEGPTVGYCTFSLESEALAPYWAAIERHTVQEIRQDQGEAFPLFRQIRQEQMRRERPLLVETLKAVAEGRVRLDGGEVRDGTGRPTGPLCLDHEVEAALSRQGPPWS